jgi:hypothetical protein
MSLSFESIFSVDEKLVAVGNSCPDPLDFKDVGASGIGFIALATDQKTFSISGHLDSFRALQAGARPVSQPPTPGEAAAGDGQ